jgi:hypothetical protein
LPPEARSYMCSLSFLVDALHCLEESPAADLQVSFCFNPSLTAVVSCFCFFFCPLSSFPLAPALHTHLISFSLISSQFLSFS